MKTLFLSRSLKYLLATLFIAAVATSGFAGQITEDIQGKLVKKGNDRELESHTIGSEPPLYVFVFSSSWCPPCNQQTLKKPYRNSFYRLILLRKN